jgi:hypothetical protein
MGTTKDIRESVQAELAFDPLVDATDITVRPEIHEAWVEEAEDSHILVRSAASAFGQVTGNGRETRRLKQPEDFVVVKGQGFI